MADNRQDTIKRTDNSPGIPPYFEAIKKILELQRGILTGVLPHKGERGRNDEMRLIAFLEQILPRRFGIGTGFIVGSDPAAEPSNQTDIVICDEFCNSPIHRELAAHVYPIESVYGTVEVKGTLSKYAKDNEPTDVDRTLQNIAKIRRLGMTKRYIRYKSVPKSKDHPDQRVVSQESYLIDLPPRSYLFAYHTDHWDKLDAFVESLRIALQGSPDAHLHGAIVLDRNWFVRQVTFTGDKKKLVGYDDNCLLRFYNSLLHGIQSMPMGVLDINRYHAPLKAMEPSARSEDAEDTSVPDDMSGY